MYKTYLECIFSYMSKWVLNNYAPDIGLAPLPMFGFESLDYLCLGLKIQYKDGTEHCLEIIMN